MKSIDLTWSGLFGGEGDGKRDTSPSDEVWWATKKQRPLHVSMLLKDIKVNNTPLHMDEKIKPDDWIDTYFLMFGKYPKAYEPYYNYDDMNTRCDCCGKNINALNSSYYLCYECSDAFIDSKIQRNMLIFQGSNLESNDDIANDFNFIEKKKPLLQKIKNKIFKFILQLKG